MDRRQFLGISAVIPTALLKGKQTDKSVVEIANNEIPSSVNNSIKHFPEFDLTKIPFSCAGSYLTLNYSERATRLKINSVRRAAISYKWQSSWAHDLMEIALFVNGNEIPFEVTATPWAIELLSGNISASITFVNSESIVICVRNCSLHFITARSLSWQSKISSNEYIVYDAQPSQYYYINSNDKAPIHLDKDSNEPERDHIVVDHTSEATVLLRFQNEENRKSDQVPDFTFCTNERKQEVDAWMAKAPKVKSEHSNALKIGWFLFWNLQVNPAGSYTRRSILSSKKSMSMIWSWDNCFNALTIVKADHKLAWDQLFVVLDNQRDNGLLPDTISDLRADFGFNKPPIWGWTIFKMLEDTPKDYWNTYLEEAYPKIVRFTNWWFNNRDLNKNGICEYMHGNDSGWDNATIFDEKYPVESPDLTAYLIIQLKALAFMASHLKKDDEATHWNSKADEQLSLFKKHFINQDSFIYYVDTPEGLSKRNSTCLITRIPLLLGNSLDAAVRDNTFEDLKRKGHFLTENGLASESLASPKYDANGYWRGAIWAPATFLIIDGLLKSNENSLARTIGQRFCDMVSREGIFAENYHPLTGEGQYDTGLTWTASDFIMIASWLYSNSVSKL